MTHQSLIANPSLSGWTMPGYMKPYFEPISDELEDLVRRFHRGDTLSVEDLIIFSITQGRISVLEELKDLLVTELGDNPDHLTPLRKKLALSAQLQDKREGGQYLALFDSAGREILRPLGSPLSVRVEDDDVDTLCEVAFSAFVLLDQMPPIEAMRRAGVAVTDLADG